jgi:hypothetical protein
MESVKQKLNKINIFFLSLLPLALASGPAIIEVITFIIIFNFFILRKPINFEKKEIYLFGCYFTLVFSSLISEFRFHSLQSSISLIRIVLLYYVFKYYFYTDLEKILKYTILVISFTFVILIFDTLFQYNFSYSFFGTEMTSENRIVMHFRDEAIMGGYLSKTIPILFGIWITRFKNYDLKSNISILSLIIMAVFSTLLTNERSASFFLIGFILIFLFFSNLKNIYKFSLILFLGSGVIFSLLNVPSLKERYIDSTLQEFFGENDNIISSEIKILRKNDNDTSSSLDKKKTTKVFIFSTAHEAHIRTAYNMFSNNYFFGVGPNNFRYLCAENRYGIYAERGCSTHPHHILSQILAETGLIGLIFYLLALAYLVLVLLKQFISKNMSYNKICMYSFYFFILMPIMPSGNIFTNWYLYSIALPFFYLRFEK